ncbi:MAG TPA: hypothetical protein VK504_18765 [Vicinamibacterales bacterium]|nr:hypothetical protein [Vicinamibacterales bacterium]
MDKPFQFRQLRAYGLRPVIKSRDLSMALFLFLTLAALLTLSAGF